MDDTNELIGLIQIGEYIDKNINLAFAAYAKFFGKLSIKSENKITALNMFTERLDKYIKANDTVTLSDYAAIYALESGFEDEYKKVSKHIEYCLKKQYK
jgi:hypothetical protein